MRESRLGVLADAGARIVGLAELEGAIASPKGLDLERVVTHRRTTGSLPFVSAIDKVARAYEELGIFP